MRSTYAVHDEAFNEGRFRTTDGEDFEIHHLIMYFEIQALL